MNREVSNLFTYVTYVLKLEEDKWYVGLTTNLNQRLTQHFTGDGAKWTQLFKPKVEH
jgi:predicted GIY-YIG superfamily endonuclease